MEVRYLPSSDMPATITNARNVDPYRGLTDIVKTSLAGILRLPTSALTHKDKQDFTKYWNEYKASYKK